MSGKRSGDPHLIYDRFLYYHCIGLAEQIVSSERYAFDRDVYTLVVLTRWPDQERLRFGRAVCDLDPVTEEGQKLDVYRHRLVFINARAPLERVPPALRPLLALIEDTLDGKVDEGKYPDEVSRRILTRIARGTLSADENARLKEEATWEHARREARSEGRAEGRREGEEKRLREALLDLCEVLGVELTEARRGELAALGLAALEALRAHLKQHRAWPSHAGGSEHR